MNKLRWMACIGLVFALSPSGWAQVKQTQKYTDPKTGITVFKGQVQLPSEGIWSITKNPSAREAVAQPILEAPEWAYGNLTGYRAGQMKDMTELQKKRSTMWPIFRHACTYAREHRGIGPARIEDIEDIEDIKNLEDKQRLEENDMIEYLDITSLNKTIYAGIWFLVPNVRIYTEWDEKPRRFARPSFASPSTPLLFELKPYLNDGKHWVLKSNGQAERVKIDPELLSRHRVTLTPGIKPFSERYKDRPEVITYKIYGRAQGDGKPSVTLSLSNRFTHATSELDWDVSRAEITTENLLTKWARFRTENWYALNTSGDAPLLNHWLARSPTLYNVSKAEPDQRRRRRNGNSTTMFNVLGGRAAVRETLQMQPLMLRDVEKGTERTIPIRTIPGVTVETHPFAEMLGGEEGGRLPIADLVPADRFFVYFAQPESMLKFLDGGVDFIFNSGVSATGRRVEYGLKDRYFKKLGLSEKWVRSFLEGGSVKELALLLPDLFLIDGTDMTIVVRLKNPKLAGIALKVLGLEGLADVAAKENPYKEQVHWALRGEWLILSTHRAELNQVLARFENQGRDSLGRSDEFRYMLTQLPINDDTRMFAYFSDPFIRRLVGPQTKIAQVRRLVARTELEGISAGALLNRMDGLSDERNLDALEEKGYVTRLMQATDTKLRKKGRVVSKTYGSIDNLTTLMNTPVDQVTPREADAYKNYLDNYNRFWRRFFDPIAIRVDQPAENEYHMSTFILPLIDNSIYNGLRAGIQPAETGALPSSPILEPMPVAQFSIQLQEESWIKWMQGLGDFWAHNLGLENLGLDTGLLDHLQPEIHLAIADADPVISLGSGELMNLLGNSRMGMAGGQMMAIPFIVSLLTRPVGIFVNIDDPKAVREILRNIPSFSMKQRALWGMIISFYKITGQDKWILNISFTGILTLNYSIEVKDHYLVLHNMPSSTGFEVKGRRDGIHTGINLELNPAACLMHLPSLHASAMGKQREAAMAGIAYLQPLLDSGYRDVKKAQAAHKQFFGFIPVHPEPGAWQLKDGQLSSTMYGSPFKQQQPVYKKGDRNFGVLNRVEHVRLGMQFEQDGLRATVRWKLR